MKITHHDNEEKKIKRRRLESYQVAELESHFNRDMYPTTEQKEDIARALNLDTGVVSKWFINRRVKLRHEGAEIEAPKPHELKRVSDKRTSGKSKRPEKSVPSKNAIVVAPPHKLSALKRPAPRIPKQRPPEVEPVSSSVIPVITKPMDHTNRVQVITGKGKKGKPMSEANAKKEEEEFWKNWVESHPSTTEETPPNPYFDYIDTKVKPEYEEEDFESKETRKMRKRKPDGSVSESQTPLFKQLLQQHQEAVKRVKVDVNPILKHIWKMREEEDLPPFFAMLTGPTLIEPHRIEDLSVVLGRNTYKHRESDIHLGDNPMISHVHARIEFDREKMCYFIVNLSKNGFSIKQKDTVVECNTLNKRYPLPTASVLNFKGILVCFQIFMINPGPMSAAEKLKEQQARARQRGGQMRNAKSYARMIEQALRKYRGQATYKEITDYIAKHCKEDIVERKTWRNSVGGVLSTNSLFEAVVDSKDPKRGRGGLWRLRDVNRTESHNNGPEKRPRKGEKTVHITLEPRKGEIIENSSTRDSEDSYEQEISIDDEEEFPIRTHRRHTVIEEDDEDEHLVIDDDPPPTETHHPFNDEFNDDNLMNNNNIDFGLMSHHGHVNPIHDISLREDDEIDIGEGPDVPVIQSTGIKIDKDYSDEEEDDFDMDTPLHHQQQLFHQWQQMNSR